MTTDRQAVAQLVEDVGEALLRCAARLRDPRMEDVPPQQVAEPVAVEAPARRKRGGAQRAVLAQLRQHGHTGATAATLAQQTGQKQPNVLRTLRALAERGHVVSDGARPAVWRIGE